LCRFFVIVFVAYFVTLLLILRVREPRYLSQRVR
jgi:hypothetical protein